MFSKIDSGEKIDYLEGVATGAHHLCKLGGIFILENAF